jgi:acetaldehyde dehydrogenase/alcohol dehydrogenase
VLICEQAAVDNLARRLNREGAYLLADDERDRIRELIFPGGSFDLRFIGKDAAFIAGEAGIRVAGNTRVLLAPFDLVVPEEPLAHEKLCPVLGFVAVPNVHRGLDAARAVLRITGPGHSAAVHSSNPRTIMDYSAAVRVLRVSVNVGNSLGSSGIETNLAPTMTIGTGYFGRSSVAENLQPKHLTQWTQVAYNASPDEPFGNFAGLTPWERPVGHMPPYPYASNLAPDGAAGVPVSAPMSRDLLDREQMTPEVEVLREEIRRMVLEELNRIVRG